MSDVRVIKKIDRRTSTAVEETLTGAFSAYGLALFIASGETAATVALPFILSTRAVLGPPS